MRAILAGGGTGGHVIPALAIASELRDRYKAEVAFVGTPRGIETRLVPKAGFPLHLIEVGGLKRVSLLTRMKTLFALPRAVIVSWKYLSELRADVVIGVGGYASGPAMLAAALKGVPTLAFEPNVVPGFANRVVAPMATMAAVHFEKTQRYFRRSAVTGVPVRRAFFDIPPRAAGARPTLLLFGGSQGAHALNVALTEALPELKGRVPGIHILHQTGERDYEATAAAYLQHGIAGEVSPFIDDMPSAFAASDLLICRSGASTVAEVAASGKPAIFIPFPGATDDHQLRNAEALAEAGAAVLLPEQELTSARLTDLVAELLNDRERLMRMSQKARTMSHSNAAGQIADLAARIAGIQLTLS